MVNSHRVIRNYKVNKVSGKLHHEGHEATLSLHVFNGQETKHRIWCQLTETRKSKLPFVEFQCIFPCRLAENIDQQSIKLSGNKTQTGMRSVSRNT